MANVLVIGKGGREHTLAWWLAQSNYVYRIFCAPGNGGIEQIAKCINYDVNDFDGITKFCVDEKIDLVVVGPEAPLCGGLVNILQENKIPAFGPTKEAAMIECSKAFAKEFMKKYDILTADFKVFSDPREARKYIKQKGAPIVVKADGLAAGKGSIVCKSLEEAINAIDSIMVKKVFKEAGNKVVIEEYLEGEEATVLALSDGKTIRPLISSQDHKPIYDGDKGPNTGGMGAYAPAPIVTAKVMKRVYKDILVPTIEHMAEEGNPFVGCLYAGLMIKDNKPFVVEFNVRFGDPEAEVVLPLLVNDSYQLLKACLDGNLGKKEYKIKNKDVAACDVVMASGGYPGKYEIGKEIYGLDEIEYMDNVYVFHAGTKEKNNKFFTNGGRVLNVVGLGNTIEKAINTAYAAVNKISWENEYHRNDIGKKALR